MPSYRNQSLDLLCFYMMATLAFNELKKRFQNRCFPVNFANFLRTHILKIIWERLVISVHSTKPTTRLALLFAEGYSFVTALSIIWNKRMNKTLSNKVTKYLKIPTTFHFAFLFENGQKKCLRGQWAKCTPRIFSEEHLFYWNALVLIKCAIINRTFN